MRQKQGGGSYDPRKAEWNGILIDDWDPAKWKQWKSKATGTDYLAVVEREYLKVRYLVEQANEKLDIAKVRVKLKLTSPQAIGLQGTFPCKPGDAGKNASPNKQYTISLGIPANEAGVMTAEKEARDLAWLLTINKFEWTPRLLGKQAQKITLPNEVKTPKLIKELIEEYEREFWKGHTRDRQGLNLWHNLYWKYLKKLPQDSPLSKEALEQVLGSTEPNTDTRRITFWLLKKFCEFFEFDCAKIIEPYKKLALKRKSRNVPDDNGVIEGFTKIGVPLSKFSRKHATLPEQWQWLYGMLATYGIRPHELFAIDLDAFADASNEYHLVKLDPALTDGTKTGERNGMIAPLPSEWVELFDLKNVKMPIFNGTLTRKTQNIADKFSECKMGFAPYDLRHAYAIRGHRLRVPMKTMADFMGHTVQEHTKSYQRWMSKNTNLEIYKEVVIEKQLTTKEDLKAEIELLKAEVESLTAENKLIKKLLTQHQLDELFSR